MTPEDFSTGEVGRALQRIEGDLREVKTDIKGMGLVYVTRAEYDVREQAIDRELKGVRAALDKGIEELKAARPMWWQVAPFLVAAMSLAIVLIEKLATH